MIDFLRWLRDLAARLLEKVDLPLLLALLCVMLISLVVLASASGENSRLVLSQGVRFAVGVGAMVLISRLPPGKLRLWTPLAYAMSLVLLALVFVFGSGRSANLWLNLGVFYLQPGELLKLSVPMMLAWYLHSVPLPPRWGTLAVSAGIIGLPVGMIILQPDLGTGMLVAASGVFALFLAGIAWWRIGLFAGLGLAALPVGWMFLMPYQRDRILTFMNPESDPLGTGWNIIQSKIAIGSGGLSGKGWGQGSQAHLDFLPEHTTDFIFSVLSEEWGWVGVVTLLGLYLFIVGRCLWIAAEARDSYSRLLAGALAMTFSVYVLVNGGMVAGLLPVVGVPMPLLSYGGTSAVSLLAGFGMVMSAQAHRKTHA
ncbi:rod shape-determining protein RodA [Arenimonas terrae]|jgi:rod shape determining protein RodA|uniref:Peptidoglycan glycosyltransferase MrdB n=1 Tax=Arenimonas terrae TaxID=2546226 RepID=A0A5C4RSX9_9GAMM|nr:rod shape-determining protein RodA [Arenimonas terrae]TNJ33971.1 rod shape-determining protein RodA [Arenimonas terrae]